MLYIREKTELNGCYELREATLEDYRRLIPQESILSLSSEILETKLKSECTFTSPDITKDFCQAKLANEEREHFMCLFLNNHHQLIEAKVLFSGSINAASVYPRVVVQEALKLNAAFLCFSHNHPGGVTSPSQADRQITRRLTDALALIDVRVLDHIIVAKGGTYSFAEHGLM